MFLRQSSGDNFLEGEICVEINDYDKSKFGIFDAVETSGLNYMGMSWRLHLIVAPLWY